MIKIRSGGCKKYLVLFLLFLLCACSGQSKLEKISDPQEYVNELAKQNYTSIYNSYVFEKSGKNGKVWTAPFAGIKSFKLPSEMSDAAGVIAASGGSETIPGLGLVTADVVYLSLSEAAYMELISTLSLASFYARSDASALQKYKQLADAYTSASSVLFSVYGIKGDKSVEDLRAQIRDVYVKYGGLAPVLAEAVVSGLSVYPAGKSGDYSFFLVQSGMQDEAAFKQQKDAGFYEEYRSLYGNIEKYPPLFTFQRPVGLTEVNLEGENISFETTDLDGNAVRSEDLFSPYKVTMINIWSTTCSVCLTEIPVLQEMNETYKAEGAQIVGLLYDGDDPGAAKEAKEFLSEYGITYLNLAANAELKNIFPTQSFPMTYYFDADGKMIGEPVIGADIKKYEEKLKENLSLVNTP